MNARKRSVGAPRAEVRATLAAAGLIQAAEGATGPDAALLKDIERARGLYEAGRQAWHMARAPGLSAERRRQLRAQAFESSDERTQLEQAIASAHPRTPEAAHAKVELALCHMEDMGGNFYDLSREALRDALTWLPGPMVRQ